MSDLRLFPMHVTLPDGRQVRPAMLTVRGGVLEVFAHRQDAAGDDVGRHVVRAYRGAVTGTEGTRDLYVADTDGGTVTAIRDGGCGCGHPLKRFRPPPP